MEFTVHPYTPAQEAAWDRFVMQESGNGTFLQTRRFLNYHPPGRFADASLLVCNEKGALAAVVPAAACQRGGQTVFCSHPGSTYGGPVLRATYNTAAKAVGIVQALESYLTQCQAPHYDVLEYKLTPALFERCENRALQYAFYYLGYRQNTELSTYVPTAGQTPETLLASLRQNKKQDVKRCLRQGLTFRPLQGAGELAAFYALLEQNLAKYHAKPVHTLAELQEFANDRLKQETGFYGVFEENGRMVAGGMTFAFAQANVLHTQYLAADLEIRAYSPAAYLYYQMLCLAAGQGYQALSWGISTEDRGHYLNYGLVESKEGYGSRHALNELYYKQIADAK